MRNLFIIITICLVSTFTLQSQTRSFKRGISYSFPLAGDIEAMSKGLYWSYNWGQETDEEIMKAHEDFGVEYIPMAWNGIDKDRIRKFLQAHPDIKYILGFNEPNFKKEASMTPTQAAAKWHEIEEIADEFGLKIVGPAVNYAPAAGAVSEAGVVYTDPVQYLDDFFAACPDCRVDYIAVHCYMNYSSSLEWYISRFKKYGKPIWLTEFCAWEDSIAEHAQKKYMVDAVNYLENDPDVYRYAWFIGRGMSDGYPYSQLLHRRNEGELKELGEIFVNMSSYDDNFYFTVPARIPGEHYVKMSGIHLEKTMDESGILNLSDFTEPDWVEYNIDIPVTGEYNIFFRIACLYGATINISANDVSVGTATVSATGDNQKWETLQSNVILQSGKQKIRFEITKGKTNLNWWALTQDDMPPAGVYSPSVNTTYIYPNPVKDILNIQSSGVDMIASLSDITGKTMYHGENVSSIDMSAYPAGMYILVLQPKNGEKKIEKIMKSN
jgi:hypothetical protein